MKRLAIITTHPIQYNAPWFRLLVQRGKIDIMVFYTWSQSAAGAKYDPGFGKMIDWDIPLLEGYPYRFVENTATAPGTRTHMGIVNPTLINEIEQYKPDAVLVSGWNFKSHLACMRHFHKKIPVLFRGDSTLIDQEGMLRGIMKRIVLRSIFRNIDKALYVGSANRRYFKRYGLKDKQLVYTPHAIDNNRFASKHETALDLRGMFAIPPGDIIYLFAGKFEEKKDPLLLLDAFTRMNNKHTHLVFAGNGKLESDLKAKAAGHSRVHFMDFQNQSAMPALYQQADIFVLPSKGPGETWGLAVNEAMAAGLPVIVSQACGCAEDLVLEGENGFSFPPGNGKLLQERMTYMATKREELSRMGKRSREIIAGFTFEKIASSIEEVVTTC